MHTSRKDTLRNSTEMTARYEKDDEIEERLANIEEDDRFFNWKLNWTFEFAKCLECGGPKIGHKERKEEKCCYGEFLEGRAWDEKDVEEMEEKIRSKGRSHIPATPW